VLDSSGSVIPIFCKQILDGGPITLIYPEITRYFMTIPEVVQLVIQAGAMAKGDDVFVLDMGDPVRIADLARRMIELSSLSVRDETNPDGDIDIVVTGLRPGKNFTKSYYWVMNLGPRRILRYKERRIHSFRGTNWKPT
jgi:FlaA1/EpsC-like NDP-sugar epimerase